MAVRASHAFGNDDEQRGIRVFSGTCGHVNGVIKLRAIKYNRKEKRLKKIDS